MRFRKAQLMSDVASVLHLSLFARLSHKTSRKTVKVFGVSATIMVSGVSIACAGHYFEHETGVHYMIFDLVGYTMHAIGSVPVCKTFEPFFVLLKGEIEKDL